jgi:hypothetical protein
MEDCHFRCITKMLKKPLEMGQPCIHCWNFPKQWKLKLKIIAFLEVINCHNWRKKIWLNCITEDCHFEQLHHKNEKKLQLEMG